MQLPRDILQRLVFLYQELNTSMYMHEIMYHFTKETGIDIIIQDKNVRTGVLNILSNYEYGMYALCVEKEVDTNRPHNIASIHDYCYNVSKDRFVICK